MRHIYSVLGLFAWLYCMVGLYQTNGMFSPIKTAVYIFLTTFVCLFFFNAFQTKEFRETN